MASSGKIRVLVVDDSALIREVIGDCLRATSDLQLVGAARDGDEALELVRSLRPDVVTLDIQMPRKDGLATLDAILEECPVPVIMVSSLTQLGAAITWEALERGALDYVAKPESARDVEPALRDELPRKIRAMAGTDVRHILRIRRERNEIRARRIRSAEQIQLAPEPRMAAGCIALGISTGGPPALTSLFEELTPPLAPILVVQHMPPMFTKPFAWRLDSISRIRVKEAENGDAVEPDHAYVAPGGRHMRVVRQGGRIRLNVFDGDPVSGHRPSCDVMMASAASVFGERCLGVIMTGMGRDGSDGCAAIRSAGGYVLGQDEASSDVYGMNKVAWTEGHVDRQFNLAGAAATITVQIQRQCAPRAAVAADM